MKTTFLLGTALAATLFITDAAAQTVPQQAPEDAQASPDGQVKDGDIVVTGYRASLETAREQKRNSDAILDAVAAEDIGQLPDNSATEALSRLPGAQTLQTRGEKQGITVRGLTQVMTTVNGQEDYTGVSRQTLLNSYPASLIASAQIYKALTPDMIEGGIAGAINIDLRKPLDFPRGLTAVGSIRGTYDTQRKTGFYNADLLLSRRWDTGIGEFGVLINASYLRRSYFEYYRQNQTPVLGAGNHLGAGLVFPGGILIRHQPGAYQRPVVTAAAQWHPSSNLALDLRVTHITDNNQRDDNYLNTGIGATNVFTEVEVIPGTNIMKSGTWRATGATGPYSSHNDINTNTTLVEFGAKYRTGIARISTQAKYTSSRNSSAARAMLFGFKTAPTIHADFESDSKYGGLAYEYVGVDMNDPNNFVARTYSDSLTIAEGHGLQWRTDLDLNLGDGLLRSLKAGFRYTNRTADYRSGSRSISLPAGTPVSALPGGDQLAAVDPGFYGDDANIPRTWTGYDSKLLFDSATYAALTKYLATLPGQAALWGSPLQVLPSFKADENTYAVYGQFKYGLELGGVPIDGVVGARLVNTALDISGTKQLTNRTTGVVTTSPISGRQNYLDVDPSASLVAHLGRQVQLRFAWSKTFTRPDFSQLNPNLTLTETTSAGGYTGTATAGNPDLQPTRSTNWDASLEWYFGRTGSASLAVFRRDVNGFIVNTILEEEVPGAGGVVDVTRPVNAGKGRFQGVELSGNTFFEFLPGLLHNFGMSGSYTYLDTNQVLPTTGANVGTSGPIPNASKYTGTISFFYDDKKFRARASYTRRSAFLLRYNTANLAYNQIYSPITQLDASVNYRFTRNISLSIDGTNLLGNFQAGYLGTPLISDRVYYVGRTISGAVRFVF
ncbi:TonB-dependent receptor [Sphingomonas sp. KR3-1]|uniref:TonB-dependent receptor n=1 Tax=Sphingomonas sp. KR3-1 TaxID=3156611 RepID=UPI0032B611E2